MARVFTNPKYWTAPEDAILRKMWIEGAPLHKIAEKMGRTVHAVQYRASQKLGLRRTADYIRQTRKPKVREYLDCIPNPFDTSWSKKNGFDINFYRTYEQGSI